MRTGGRDESGLLSPSYRPVELVIVVGILLVLAGLILPALRSARIERDIEIARSDLIEIREAVRAFLKDVGVGPCRDSEGRDGRLVWLIGPGEVAGDFYFVSSDQRGWLEDHLQHNRPGERLYEGWRGPYLRDTRADPWGRAYVVVLYPMFREDDRDCIVVSAGPNGCFDSSYTSPRDPVPAADDLLEVVFDKSPARPAPITSQDG